MLRQQGGPVQNVADQGGAGVLVLEDGLHHLADDLAVPLIHTVLRHDDEGKIQLVGQLQQLSVHPRQEDAHIIQNQPHLARLGQPPNVSALGLHIIGDVHKAGDDHLAAVKLIVFEQRVLQNAGIGVLQHRDGRDQLVQPAPSRRQPGLPQAG